MTLSEWRWMENPHINIKFVIYWQHCLLCVESRLWDQTLVGVDRVEEHYGDWSPRGILVWTLSLAYWLIRSHLMLGWRPWGYSRCPQNCVPEEFSILIESEVLVSLYACSWIKHPEASPGDGDTGFNKNLPAPLASGTFDMCLEDQLDFDRGKDCRVKWEHSRVFNCWNTAVVSSNRVIPK